VTLYLVILLVLLSTSSIKEQLTHDILGLCLEGAVFLNIGASLIKMIVSVGAQALENCRLAKARKRALQENAAVKTVAITP
jgi:hypothetical protein